MVKNGDFKKSNPTGLIGLKPSSVRKKAEDNVFWVFYGLSVIRISAAM